MRNRFKKVSMWLFSHAFWSKNVYFAGLPYYAIVKWLIWAYITLTLENVEKWTTKNDVRDFRFWPLSSINECAYFGVFGLKIGWIVFCRWSFEVIIVLFAHFDEVFNDWVRIQRSNRTPGDVLRHPGVSTNGRRLYNFSFARQRVWNVRRLATVKITPFLERKELRKRTQLKLICECT